MRALSTRVTTNLQNGKWKKEKSDGLPGLERSKVEIEVVKVKPGGHLEADRAAEANRGSLTTAVAVAAHTKR